METVPLVQDWGLTKKGKPDMRLKSNRQELGRYNIDGTPDMRYKVNKTRSKSLSKGKKVEEKATLNPQETKVPLKKDGTPDMRYKVNKTRSKSLSKGKKVEEKATLNPQETEVPLKKDGTPDMRYKVNKTRSKPPSKGKKVEEKATLNPQETEVPLKKDGTPDMRYKVNKTRSKPPSKGKKVEEKATLNPQETDVPLKKDGTPDMRYKVNKTASRSSSSSGTGRSSSGESIGPLKSDGTPDMRYAVNKAPYSRSSESSGNSSDNEPGTFKCKLIQCKTCPFISNSVEISGPNRSVKVTEHFTCISEDVIYCITCTLCKKIYIGETGRELAVRFGEHLRDVKNDASTSVARHFNLPNHSYRNMTICGLSLHHENSKSRQSFERKLISQLGTLYPHGINKRRC